MLLASQSATTAKAGIIFRQQTGIGLAGPAMALFWTSRRSSQALAASAARRSIARFSAMKTHKR
tara:strand:- start:14690 stop:14881 length:192 start_codon:yes stop_codon:yes gene_type:complete